MKIIIAGTRKMIDPAKFKYAMDMCQFDLKSITEYVCGACPTGVDFLAVQWAKTHKIHMELFPALWDVLDTPRAVIRTRRDGTKYNAMAGPDRNWRMVDYADGLIALPSKTGSRGTWGIIDMAKQRELPTFILEV